MQAVPSSIRQSYYAWNNIFLQSTANLQSLELLESDYTGSGPHHSFACRCQQEIDPIVFPENIMFRDEVQRWYLPLHPLLSAD